MTDTPLDLGGLELHPFAIPMRLTFRRTTVRRGVLLHGPAGWAEFSPFPEYPPTYARRWLSAAVAVARDGLPPPVRERVAVNVTIPAVDPATAAARVRASPCRTAKVKVAEPGQTLADDVARVRAVREALGPDGRLRVDANAAWDLDEATVALERLATFELDYAEQPVAEVADMVTLRQRVAVRIAADEVVRTATDPTRLALAGAADVLVLKAQPLGGPAAALTVAAAAGLPVVVSSALETSVGLAAGLAFAAALPQLDGACGLATADLLGDDVTDEPLLPEPDGMLVVRAVVPDRARLQALRPPPDVADDLLDRVRRAATAATNYR